MDAKRALAIGIAVLGVVRPRTLLRLNARANLVGYSGREDVEPKGWLVVVTRLVAAVALVGLWVSRESGGDGNAL